MRLSKKAVLYATLLVLVALAGVWRYTQPSSDEEVALAKPRRRPKVDLALFPLSGPEPTLVKDKRLTSRLCTRSQFETDVYAHWCSELKEKKRYHRKQWEFVFILQALSERGMLGPGTKGVGFGVGQEPLPAVMAKHGVDVLATDLDFAEAEKLGWTQSGQHMSSIEVLNKAGIASPEEFKRVRVQNVDMNHIPVDLVGFDFTWSSCALGHLGNLEKGLVFIENSLKTLKPGGVAVHTTELNLSSATDTMETTGTSVYRKSDIEALVARLKAQGHEVEVNYHHGPTAMDQEIDFPPYSSDHHIKIELGGFVVTSLGLIIRKNPNAAP